MWTSKVACTSGRPSSASTKDRSPSASHFSSLASRDVHEWYDDQAHQFRIEVRVSNSRWGPRFGYRGYFEVEWRALGADGLPTGIQPQRVEPRE